MKAKTFNPKPRARKVHFARSLFRINTRRVTLCNSELCVPAGYLTRDKDAITCKDCKRLLGVM